MKRNPKYPKVGMMPGSFIHTGERKSENIEVTVTKYSEEEYEVHPIVKVEDLKKLTETEHVSWINVDGLHEVDVITRIGELYNLHHLLIEDVLNTHHRPKSDQYPDYLFVSLKMLSIENPMKEIESEQISLVLGENWLLSFQEKKGDVFNDVRTNIAEAKGIVRKRHADYLFYRLLDVVVDNYYLISDAFEEHIEVIEDRILKDEITDTPQEIQLLKKQIIQFNKDIRPLKDAVSRILKDENNRIDQGTKIYLSDVNDHLVQVSEMADIQRDNLSNLLDLYVSGLSNRMNQVMKFLTVISTIFIPLSFIVGLYGMNFKYMPELKWEYGYPFVWALMIAVTASMLIYFTVRNWWK